MRLVASIAAVFVAALVFAVNSPSASAEAAQKPKPKQKPKGTVVVVERGDSLSKIAKRHDSTYQRIYYANESIKHPDLIYPDTKLRVPHADEKLKKRPLPADAAVPATRRSTASKPRTQTRTYSAPAPRYEQPAPADSHINGGVWDRLAACESGGNWAINTGNGYFGGLQFSLSSWRAVGGQGYPHQASKAEQIARAQKLQAIQGWGAWPACTAKLGIR